MRDVALNTDATFEEVAQSAARYAEFERAMRPYKGLLDVWISRHFGNRRAEELASLHGAQVLALARHDGEAVGGAAAEGIGAGVRGTLEQAAALARERGFFHWDLEFPEVFVDLEHARWKDNPGFDAVIGNPPYVRQELLTPLKPFLSTDFRSYHGVADLYLFFYEQGLRFLRGGGRIGYISSGTFARANFAAPFREMLPSVAQIESLIDFGENQPFEGAEMVRPSIVVLSKREQTEPFRSLFIDNEVPKSLGDALATEGITCDPAALRQSEWTFQPAAHTRLFEKLLASGDMLADVVDGQMYRGVLTGLNEAFIIGRETRDRLVAEDPSSAEIIKPVLQGQDLRPWYQEDEGRWLIFTRRGIDLTSYPGVRDYLTGYRVALEPKPADWQSGRSWPGRKAGSYEWYEIQDSVDYYSAFEQPKIFWPDIAKLPRFSWGDAGVYVTNTSYFLPAADPALLGIVQSRVSWFAVMQLCQPLRLRGGLWQYRMFSQFLGRLPIPDAPAPERETIGALALAVTEQARARYALHQRTRHRILSDLGAPDSKLNRKLTEWWALDFAAFRKQVKKVFKHDIPLAQRDEWEEWLGSRRREHEGATAEIVRMETELNKRVYALFELTPAEIRIIEESTKYEYGEV